MMTISLNHSSLQSTLVGIEIASTAQFRGIPYGNVAKRFAQPRAVADIPKTLDCSKYGPRCPQVLFDVGHLLRIPSDQVLPTEPEDEFACLNLDVVVPKKHLSGHSGKLPVLVWIHGGSQAITFGSAASGICDPTKIVEDSLSQQKPIIFVSVQYRLNIFAFGQDADSSNLALRDQALALEWIQKHISGFGGDPDRVTLYGESAGAVYCHAHMVSKAPASQVILSSGSLYLSPPQSQQRASGMRQTLDKHLQDFGKFSLEDAPAPVIIEAVQKSGIQSWFLVVEPQLENWESATGIATKLMLSDMQDEAVLWRSGMWSADLVDIVAAFDLAGELSPELKRLYHIDPARPSSCKIGALDFLNDYKYVLPIENIVQLWRSNQKPAYHCIVDENNPWQSSHGAHHAIDLVFLFGGLDLSFSRSAAVTGENMRKKWIEFVNSEQPWSPDSVVAFGPHGLLQELDSAGLESRRRMAQVNRLGKLDTAILDKVFMSLAAGKISLLN